MSTEKSINEPRDGIKSAPVLNLRPLSPDISKRWHISKLRLSNLQKLAKANATNRNFQWEKFGYCCGAILRQFDPDRKYQLRLKAGALRWRTWPSCSPETVLTHGTHRLEVSIQNVPKRILKDVDAGLRRSRGFKGVMGSELVAKIMGVTYAMRQQLDLRAIGAIDVAKADRQARAAARRRARSAALKKAIRGCKSRAEYIGGSIAEAARQAGVNASTLRSRLKRERDISQPKPTATVTVLKPRDRRNRSGAPQDNVVIHLSADTPVASVSYPTEGKGLGDGYSIGDCHD